MTENIRKPNFASQAVIFIVLAACCVLLYVFLTKQHENKSAFFSVSQSTDSAAITRWDVVPHGNKSLTYNVFKDSGIWKIRLRDNNIVDADLTIVGRSLKHLAKFGNAEHVHLDKSKWKAEGLDDSATKITVHEGERIIGIYYIGKLGFLDQYKSCYYFRPAQSDSVYRLVETYLDGSVMAKEDNFRKKALSPVDPSFYKRVRIVSADTNVYYLLENVNGKWSVSGRDVDQRKALTYVKMLSMLQIPRFTIESTQNKPEASVLIDTKYGPINLIASRDKNGDWIMASSVNVGNRVELTLPQVNAIFPPFHYFIH